MINKIQEVDSDELQTESIQQEIQQLVKQLPLDSLKIAFQFINFLAQQMPNALALTDGDNSNRPILAEQNRVNIVPVAPSSLTGLIGLMSPGYKGDALKDTEALYDDI